MPRLSVRYPRVAAVSIVFPIINPDLRGRSNYDAGAGVSRDGSLRVRVARVRRDEGGGRRRCEERQRRSADIWVPGKIHTSVATSKALSATRVSRGTINIPNAFSSLYRVGIRSLAPSSAFSLPARRAPFLVLSKKAVRRRSSATEAGGSRKPARRTKVPRARVGEEEGPTCQEQGEQRGQGRTRQREGGGGDAEREGERDRGPGSSVEAARLNICRQVARFGHAPWLEPFVHPRASP